VSRLDAISCVPTKAAVLWERIEAAREDLEKYRDKPPPLRGDSFVHRSSSFLLPALAALIAVVLACAQKSSVADDSATTSATASTPGPGSGGLTPGRYDCYGILGASTGGSGSYVWIVGFDLTPQGTYRIDDEEYPYRYDAGAGTIEWQGGFLEGHRTTVTSEWIKIAFEEHGAEAECERPAGPNADLTARGGPGT
jgi:hypothetical protein